MRGGWASKSALVFQRKGASSPSCSGNGAAEPPSPNPPAGSFHSQKVMQTFCASLALAPITSASAIWSTWYSWVTRAVRS